MTFLFAAPRFSQHSLFAALLLALCACGDDGGGGSAGNGGGAQGLDACSIVTQADATALFGQPAVPDENEALVVDPALLGECLWSWDTETSNQLLQFYVWEGAEYHSVPTGSGWEPLAVGEQGYVLVGPVLGVDMGWLQDNRAIMLSYSKVGSDVPPVETKVDAMKALAQEVSSRL